MTGVKWYKTIPVSWFEICRGSNCINDDCNDQIQEVNLGRADFIGENYTSVIVIESRQESGHRRVFTYFMGISCGVHVGGAEPPHVPDWHQPQPSTSQ